LLLAASAPQGLPFSHILGCNKFNLSVSFLDPSTASRSQGKPTVYRIPLLIFTADAANANFFSRLQPLISLSLRRAAAEESQRSLQINSTGLRLAVNTGPTPQLCRFNRSAGSVAIPTYSEPSRQRTM